VGEEQDENILPCELQRDLGDNSAAVLITLLHSLDIPASPHHVRKRIQAQESPASALGIVNCATELGVPLDAFEADLDALSDLNPPFIAHLLGDMFTVIQKVSGTEVTLADPQKGLITMNREEYERKSSGIYIVLSQEEPLAFQPPKDYPLSKTIDFWENQQKWIVFGGLTAILLGFSLVSVLTLPRGISGGLYSSLLGINFISFAIAFLLAEYVLEGHNPASVVGRFCALSSRLNCSSVLLSPNALLFGRFPWATMGLGFYFSIQVLLGVVGIGTVPFVTLGYTASLILAGYLIHMQSRVLKEWCAWCMILHGLNLLACLLSWALFLDCGFDLEDLASRTIPAAFLSTLLLGGLISVYFVRMKNKAVKDSNQLLEKEVTRSKKPQVLASILETTEPENIMLEKEEEWLTGHPEAPMTLVVFSNPFCPACAGLDRTLRETLSGGLPLQLIVRLSGGKPPQQCPDILEDRSEIAGSPLKKTLLLYAIGSSLGAESYHQAMGTLYSRQDEFYRKSVREMIDILGVPLEAVKDGLSSGFARYVSDEKIFEKNSIEKTPALFLNGRPLPDWVRVPELTGLLQFLFARQPDQPESGE
jgi:uncharacterized membrane protein/predicted double-glycine peptidase